MKIAIFSATSLSHFASFMGLDLLLILFAVGTFILIGVGLASLILLTKSKLVNQDLCTIKINDDNALTIETPGGGTLLNALTSNGIPVPCPCGGKATCKQCRVQVLEGVAPPLQTDIDTFSKKQLKLGWRLSCQSKVKKDLHVHIEESALGVKEWNARVLSNQNVATFIKELIVEIPEGEIVPYRSGGYLQVHVPSFKTNTEEWKATMEPCYFSDWNKYQLFGHELDFNHLPNPPNEIIRAYF